MPTPSERAAFYSTLNVKSTESLKPWRNQFEGQRAFLCGNGPTLEDDLIRLWSLAKTHGEALPPGVLVGTNRAPLATPWVTYRLLVISDHRPLTWLYAWGQEDSLRWSETQLFCASTALRDPENLDPRWVVYHQEKPPVTNPIDRIQCQIESGVVPCRHTVIEPALSILLWMGFREVVVLGVNCGFRDPEKVRAGNKSVQTYGPDEQARLMTVVSDGPDRRGLFQTQNHIWMQSRMNSFLSTYGQKMTLRHLCRWTELNWPEWEYRKAVE